MVQPLKMSYQLPLRLPPPQSSLWSTQKNPKIRQSKRNRMALWPWRLCSSYFGKIYDNKNLDERSYSFWKFESPFNTSQNIALKSLNSKIIPQEMGLVLVKKNFRFLFYLHVLESALKSNNSCFCKMMLWIWEAGKHRISMAGSDCPPVPLPCPPPARSST
jgi:hypothetical protein